MIVTTQKSIEYTRRIIIINAPEISRRNRNDNLQILRRHLRAKRRTPAYSRGLCRLSIHKVGSNIWFSEGQRKQRRSCCGLGNASTASLVSQFDERLWQQWPSPSTKINIRGECSKMPRVSKMPTPLKTYCNLQICILVVSLHVATSREPPCAVMFRNSRYFRDYSTFSILTTLV